MAMHILMVDKNGREWMAGSAVEINDLQSQGYRIKGTGAPAPPTALDTSAPAEPAAPETSTSVPVTSGGADTTPNRSATA